MPRPTPPLPSRVSGLARGQDALITRSQALTAGLTSMHIEGHLRTGRWVRVLPQVYSTDATAIGPLRFIRAVWLWAGPDAVIEGAAALIWQGRLDRPLSTVTVSCGRNMRVPTGKWSVQVRRHAVNEFWWVHWNQVVTVRTEFAIAQLLPVEGPALLDDAVRRRWVTVDMVAQAHRALSPGRGSATRATILTVAQGGAISEAERLLHHHLKRAGIGGWRANAPVRLGAVTCVGDLVFDEIRLLVEIDGFAFHTDHARYENARFRQTSSRSPAGRCCDSPGGL